MTAVEVSDLKVRYGDLVAVDGVSFTAEAGCITAVLGPNGAGKTSTIEVCEGYRTASFEDDAAFARTIGDTAIDVYAALVRAALAASAAPTETERAAQLAYHTTYLFQVLTLDRGTTSGLLVHDQNDVGILGSLPSHVDRALLASWESRVSPPQDALVRALVDAIPAPHGGAPSPIEPATKRALAAAVRQFYRAHPEALALQASGNVIPATVANHR